MERKLRWVHLTTVNLPGALNPTVLRWRMASDNSVAAQGWRIDTIVVTECLEPHPTPTPSPPPPSPTPTPTPAPTPTPINISGAIFYCSNPSLGPVPSVTLNLTGSATTSTTTNGSGNYQFSSLMSGGNYTVTPTRSDLPPGLGTTGINTADAQLVQKHFQSGGTLLTGCALAAARTNANNLGDPNTGDALSIQQFFLFAPNPLPGGNRAGQWRFSPANRTYPGVNSDQTGQNYDAFALGDVNGDLTIPVGSLDLPTTPSRFLSRSPR